MSLDLPVHGDANWDVKLNAALTQLNGQDTTLATNLAAEITRATLAEAANATAITAEATARATAITNAISALVNGAPGALDTLNELATALAADESAATTLAALVGTKAPLASPTFTGTPAVPTAAPGTNTTQAASTAFTTAAVTAEATARDAAILAQANIAKGTYAPLVADWTASTAYTVGQLVTNGGQVYRVSTAHTSTGSFDATKFTSQGGTSLAQTVTNGVTDSAPSQDAVYDAITGAIASEAALRLTGDAGLTPAASIFGFDPNYTDGTLNQPWKPPAAYTANLVGTLTGGGSSYTFTNNAPANNQRTTAADVTLTNATTGVFPGSSVRVLFTFTNTVNAGGLYVSFRQANGTIITGTSEVQIVNALKTGYTGLYEVQVPAGAVLLRLQFGNNNDYTSGGQFTLSALDVRMVAAVGPKLRGGLVDTNADTSTSAPSGSGNIARLSVSPDGRPVRINTTFGSDGATPYAYSASFAFDERAYAVAEPGNSYNSTQNVGNGMQFRPPSGFFSQGGGNIFQTASLHINNNDLVMNVRRPDTTFELRCNTHGGETSLTGSLKDDVIWEVDRGYGTWDRMKGNLYEYTGYRMRVTIYTKVSYSTGGQFATIARVYTFFADGMTRVDRTITFTAATTVEKFFYIMNSIDPNRQANLGRTGQGQRVHKELNGRRPANYAGPYFGRMSTVTTGVAAAATGINVAGNNNATRFYKGALLRIGTGLATAETVRVLTADTAGNITFAALTNAHSAGETVDLVEETVALSAAANAYDSTITTDTPVSQQAYLSIGSGPRREVRSVRAAYTGTGPYTLQLSTPLEHDHPSGEKCDVFYAGNDYIADGAAEWCAHIEPEYNATFGQIFDRAAITAHGLGSNLYTQLIQWTNGQLSKAYTILIPTPYPATISSGTVLNDTFYWYYYVPRNAERYHDEIATVAVASPAQRAAIYPAA